jgi:L-cystine uptake protein TcyP (sodium:dicarboxylate symporter family)
MSGIPQQVLRLIPKNAISSITKERQFSAAMINNQTQLVIVDERSATRMDSDLAKCILQGGWMVSAVKHDLSRTVMSNSPYCVTTNHIPDFAKDDENVRQRISIFTTTYLPHT